MILPTGVISIWLNSQGSTIGPPQRGLRGDNWPSEKQHKEPNRKWGGSDDKTDGWCHSEPK